MSNKRGLGRSTVAPIGSAPRARRAVSDPETSSSPPRASDGPHGPDPAGLAPASAADPAPRPDAADLQQRALALVEGLARGFVEQVRRALHVELDGSPTSLAFVDHYLSLAREEEREPIVSLLAAGAGAYFGELVRREMGGTWVGDGRDPRRLRLLVEPQFIHFGPIDQAYEAIAGQGLAADDPRVSPGPAFDSAFNLQPPRADDEPGQEDDGAWLSERLAELPPVPEDEFHSLTCRFETLQLMLELLAAKHAHEGLPPRRLAVSDYVEVLSGRAIH